MRREEAYFMCRQTGQRHSVLCALPPQILRRVAENGTVEQREAALQTLATDSTYRTLRAIRLAAPVTTPAAVAVADQLQRTISNARNTQTTARYGGTLRGGLRDRRPGGGRGLRWSGRHLRVLPGDAGPQLHRRSGPTHERHRPLQPELRQCVLGRTAHGLRRRRRGSVQPFHRRGRHHGARVDPRRHGVRGATGLLPPVRGAERVALGRVRFSGQTVQERQAGRRGRRLADRRGAPGGRTYRESRSGP